MSRSSGTYDAVIVGGGPAGLSAGLWLGRYRRRVRLYDAGRPRNEATWAVHGYPGLPDLSPAALRRRLLDQAMGAGLEYVPARVSWVGGEKDAFQVEAADTRVRARRLVLALGCRDRLPPIPGLRAAYGVSVFHCPDCDGPSTGGSTVGVIGRGRRAAGLALYLLTWAERVILLTHGGDPDLEGRLLDHLAEHEVLMVGDRVAEIRSRHGRIQQICLEDGRTLRLDAIFIRPARRPANTLARHLGCEVARDGRVRVDPGMRTTVQGVLAAGDLVGHPHLAIAAADQGVRAAIAAHRSLLPASFWP